MSNCNFHVGQKVAPIHDLANGTKRGTILTIIAVYRGFYGAPVRGDYTSACICFAEIAPREGFIGFDFRGFRPLVQRKTDISIFTDMLIEQKHPVTA